MKARALVVPRADGEATRRELADAGWLRTDLRIASVKGTLVLPVLDDAPIPAEWGSLGSAEFEPRPEGGPSDYRDLLAWSAAEKELLPRSFDIVGDVVLVRLPRELESRGGEIGEALRRFVPHARTVGWDRGVHGVERRRTIERLAGDGGWATVHRENGLELSVDLGRAYFSPRLAREHALVAAEVRPGETVYDLCCGVGPFAVHIARDGRARAVVAVDVNPDAISLLRQTLQRYPFGSRVRPEVAPIEGFLPSAPPCDRAILNLPHEGIKYAPSVARTVGPGGRLHLYEVVARNELADRGHVIAERLEPRGAWDSIAQRIVHPYSPDSDLIAFTLARAAE